MSEALVPYVDMQNMAKAIATSGLFGIKTPEQALALMLIAQAEGLHPAIAARDYDIIQGRPAKKSEAMMRAFLLAGGSIQWHELSDTKAEATFSHPQGGVVKLDWTIERATKAGLTQKQNRDGSPNMYAKYPRQMLRARVISEGVRTICPLATSGLYTPEETEDMANEGPINIETRRRTGHGYSREQLPEQGETIQPIPETKPPIQETKPVVYEPKGQERETEKPEQPSVVPCSSCHAPAGKPHASGCKNPPQSSDGPNGGNVRNPEAPSGESVSAPPPTAGDKYEI